MSSVSYLEFSGGAVRAVNISRSFMLNKWIFDHVPYSHANSRVTPVRCGEHACLATESAISFPKISLCPGMHYIVICLLRTLNLNNEGVVTILLFVL